jgi:hypothetical protein
MVDREHKDDYEEYFQSCEDDFLDDAQYPVDHPTNLDQNNPLSSHLNILDLYWQHLEYFFWYYD